MAICLIICSIYYLEPMLMHDVVCEFACAVGCAEETTSVNVLKTFLWIIRALEASNWSQITFLRLTNVLTFIFERFGPNF